MDRESLLNHYMARRRDVLKGALAGAAAATLPGLARTAAAAPADPVSFVG